MGAVSNFDLIIFDMEDALVDQRNSLCTAVSRGVDAYLISLLGLKPEGGPVFTSDEVHEFAQTQGFDSKVDLMNALLLAALHWLPEDISEDDFDGLDGRDLLHALSQRPEMDMTLGALSERKNMIEFGKMLRSKGSGQRGVTRVRGLRNRWMALSEGHIMMDNFVQRIFYEAYLGEKLFLAEHGQERQFVTETGAIELEKSWNHPNDLAHVRKRCPLGTVTSRSQEEAQFVLDRLEIRRFLDVVVSKTAMGMGMADPEETRRISSLGVAETSQAAYHTRVTEAIERIRGQEGLQSVVRVAYVGNCAPDARGISSIKDRYRMTAVGTIFGQDRKAATAQREKGADLVAYEPQQMVKMLTERPRPRSGYRRHR